MVGITMKSNDIYVYFLYSDQQMSDRTKIERTINRTFKPGTVIVNGKKKLFTEISKKPTNRYPDCKVVAEGYKSQMTFTDTISQ